jgi:hypothetical protein
LSLPDYSLRHPILSLTGGLGEGAAEEVTVAAGFMAAGFMAAEAFMAGVVSEAFAADVSGAFTTIAVFSFPVSVSMGTRGGGIGVIRTILTTRTITPAHTTVTVRTTAIDS